MTAFTLKGLLTRKLRTVLTAIAIILGASALWLTDAVHHLDPALPALLALSALLVPGFGPLVWADLERGGVEAHAHALLPLADRGVGDPDRAAVPEAGAEVGVGVVVEGGPERVVAAG